VILLRVHSGYLFLIDGDVKIQARVAPFVLAQPLPPFDSQIPVRFPTKGVFWAFFGAFLALIGVHLHSKTVRFERIFGMLSFVFNKLLASLVSFSIFFCLPVFFLCCHASFCHQFPLLAGMSSCSTTTIGYHRPGPMSRKKWRKVEGQKGR